MTDEDGEPLYVWTLQELTSLLNEVERDVTGARHAACHALLHVQLAASREIVDTCPAAPAWPLRRPSSAWLRTALPAPPGVARKIRALPRARSPLAPSNSSVI